MGTSLNSLVGDVSDKGLIDAWGLPHYNKVFIKHKT